MNITDVRAYPLKTRTALVRVFTDEGVEGIGECSPMNIEIMAHFVETALKPLLMGKDPLEKRIDPEADTYWVDAQSARPSESYFKQF